MQRRFRIDFIESRWRLGALGWVCLGITVLLALAWSRLALSSHQRIEQLIFSKQALERNLARERPVSGSIEISTDRARSVNQAIRRLNHPWEDVLRALNDAASPHVALLELAPEFSTGTVRLVAEARTIDAALSLQKKLARDPSLRSVVLTKHEFLSDAPGRPVRFVLDARLGDQP